jgi:hypothetical protein
MTQPCMLATSKPASTVRHRHRPPLRLSHPSCRGPAHIRCRPNLAAPNTRRCQTFYVPTVHWE